VEGGATLLQSFIDQGLWDEARVITNNDLNIPDGLPSPFSVTKVYNIQKIYYLIRSGFIIKK
jgi:riboflavin biosynthesis pyrimidine reductase